MRNLDRVDHVVLNAGIMEYPNVGPAFQVERQVCC